MRRESERSRSMKGGLYVLAHITHPDCTWSCGYFRGHQLESVHGTDNVVSGFRHRGGAARAYFARRRWSAHFVISTVRGLFAVLHPRGKPAQCARTASAAGTRRPGGSLPVQPTSLISGKGAGRLGEKTEESKVVVLAKLEALERELRSVVEQSGNTLAAYIGEIEDRLERAPGGRLSKDPV